MNARTDDPSGAPAKGHFRLNLFDVPLINDVKLSGSVVCVVTVGNSAWWRGVIEKSDSPLLPVGFGVFARIIDNGQGDKDPPDAASVFLTPPPTPTCPVVPFATSPATAGNMRVFDGA